jgi:hypothetical protein
MLFDRGVRVVFRVLRSGGTFCNCKLVILAAGVCASIDQGGVQLCKLVIPAHNAFLKKVGAKSFGL